MPNMRMTKNPMPSQDPNVRNKNFKEVTLGYTEEMALDEAQRCLNCKNMPCVSGCPVNIHIPEFIKKVAGRHRPSGAFCCRLAQRTRYRCHHHRAEKRPQGCRYRFRPCGSYLRGRPRKAGLRCDDLRSAAPCRRRARVRHPGVPSAEVHRAEGSR